MALIGTTQGIAGKGVVGYSYATKEADCVKFGRIRSAHVPALFCLIYQIHFQKSRRMLRDIISCYVYNTSLAKDLLKYSGDKDIRKEALWALKDGYRQKLENDSFIMRHIIRMYETCNSLCMFIKYSIQNIMENGWKN